MISSLQLHEGTPRDFPWFAKTSFCGQKQFDFKPGLTVIYGPNGSGKTTLVSMLADYLAAQQGGVSAVTERWVRDQFKQSETLEPGYTVVHDGQPAMYFSGYAKVGLVGSNFDDDFFFQGLSNAFRKGSNGELALQRLGRIVKILNGSQEVLLETEAEDWGFPDHIHWSMEKEAVNTLWQARLDKVAKQLQGTLQRGPKTLLLDEPDTGFGVEWQEKLWNGLLAKVDAQKYQVIVATHSPFSLGIPGATYIETAPGIIDRATVALRKLAVLQ